MGWPQYVYLAMVFLGLGISLAQHGQPRKPENAWNHIIGAAIGLFLLVAGGFFDGR